MLVNTQDWKQLSIQRLQWLKRDIDKYIKSIENGTTLHMREEREEIKDLTVNFRNAPTIGIRITLEFYKNNLDSK